MLWFAVWPSSTIGQQKKSENPHLFCKETLWWRPKAQKPKKAHRIFVCSLICSVFQPFGWTFFSIFPQTVGPPREALARSLRHLTLPTLPTQPGCCHVTSSRTFAWTMNNNDWKTLEEKWHHLIPKALEVATNLIANGIAIVRNNQRQSLRRPKRDLGTEVSPMPCQYSGFPGSLCWRSVRNPEKT